MILEYSYDKANEILLLFKESKIATLNIQPRATEDGTTYIMEYSLIDSYVDSKRENMRKILAESLPIRLRITELLNEFIENQTLDNVREFRLYFNIVDVRKCEIDFFTSFGNNTNNISDIKQLQKCLERYDAIITRMGVGGITIPNVFRKEGNGKNRKNIPITLQDIGETVRHALMEK